MSPDLVAKGGATHERGAIAVRVGAEGAAREYRWIVLSPHRDDAVFSCGGLIASRRARGEAVLVVNVCTLLEAEPMTPLARLLRARYGRPLSVVFREREREDAEALRLLGVDVHDVGAHDAVARDPKACRAPADLFRESSSSAELSRLVDAVLVALAEGSPNAILVAPAGVGGHIDHRVVSSAARRCAVLREVWLYEDLPYAALGVENHERAVSGLSSRLLDVTTWFEDKRRALRAYASERAFFTSLGVDIEAAIVGHARSFSGLRRCHERYWIPARGCRVSELEET